uniref:Hsp90 co-chaperone Cdc37 n=1 Tax=Felis catus TaxID=9685 RepID=A0ABI7X7V9_FELCA
MVDYSVWDHIEVSDDEDETHPKIDTASLFCWQHQARVELPLGVLLDFVFGIFLVS